MPKNDWSHCSFSCMRIKKETFFLITLFILMYENQKRDLLHHSVKWSCCIVIKTNDCSEICVKSWIQNEKQQIRVFCLPNVLSVNDLQYLLVLWLAVIKGKVTCFWRCFDEVWTSVMFPCVIKCRCHFYCLSSFTRAEISGRVQSAIHHG